MGRSLTIIDADYKNWVKELSQRYRRSQIKAAVKVNNEVLQFYWELGRDIVGMDPITNTAVDFTSVSAMTSERNCQEWMVCLHITSDIQNDSIFFIMNCSEIFGNLLKISKEPFRPARNWNIN